MKIKFLFTNLAWDLDWLLAAELHLTPLEVLLSLATLLT